MTGADIIARAVADLGLGEDPPGSNRSPILDALCEDAGIEPDSPWCALILCWRWLKPMRTGIVKTDHGRAWSFNGRLFYPSASGLRLWKYNQHLRVTPGGLLRLGDIGIEDHGGGKSHVYVVELARHKRGDVVAISGNTNDMGSREGNVVGRNVRRLDRAVGFLRVWGEP